MVAKESAPTCTDMLVEVINVTMWSKWYIYCRTEQLGTASAGEEDCPYATIRKVSAHLAGLLKVCDVVSVVSGSSQFVWTNTIADIDEV